MSATRFQPVLAQMKNITGSPQGDADIRIENFVGYAKLPVGIAGPLEITTPEGENETIHAPIATTEDALIASCCRGCKAFNLCGGVEFDVLAEGMSRAPYFRFPSPREAIAFSRRLPEIQDLFARAAETTSRHLRLQRIVPHIIGSSVHLYTSYHCGDAAGQNMVTIATHQAFEGQMASDKKPSWGHVQQPRGVEVMAWGTLSNDVCESVLGCTTEMLYRMLMTAQDGGIRNGQFGSNVNTANIIAGIFVAAGQDAASVAEASWSHLVCDYDGKSGELSVSVYFPSLPVGVVGGGTAYATQKECLEMMNCRGPGGKKRLAGIIASFALALDMSTAAAMITNTFSQAHERLARKSVSQSSRL